MIFHSDRGTQCMSQAFAQACWRLAVVQSASRTRPCLDNALAQSCFATLKVDLFNRCRYQTRQEVRPSLVAWIGGANHRRLHSSLGYRPSTGSTALACFSRSCEARRLLCRIKTVFGGTGAAYGRIVARVV
jgi:transposase InsO family protein